MPKYQGLSLQESKKDSGHDADLTDTENEHPADNIGLNLSQALFKFFIGNFQYRLLDIRIDLVKHLNQSIGALIRKPISQNLWNGNNRHDVNPLAKGVYHNLCVLSNSPMKTGEMQSRKDLTPYVKSGSRSEGSVQTRRSE